MEYVDHLKEYMTERVKKYLENHELEDLPVEFKGIPRTRLIDLLIDQSTPILRKIEDDALRASVESVAALIRYSKKGR